MNTIKQLLLTLLVALFITPAIYAQPCIGDNCLASIGNSKKVTTKSAFPLIIQKNEESIESDMITLDDNMGMIDLTDNTAYYSDNQIESANLDKIEFQSNLDDGIEYIDEEQSENSIVLVDETMQSIDNDTLVTTDIIYACDDFVGENGLVCDNVTKECQCV